MPAARHASRSPAIAFAVMADDPRPGGVRPARPDPAGGLQAIQLGHLDVHEDDVVVDRLDARDGLEPVPRRRPPGSPSARAGGARASGSPRCPRPAGSGADGARRGRGRCRRRSRRTGDRAVAWPASDRREGVVQRRRLDRLDEERPTTASLPARGRPSEDRMTTGVGAPASEARIAVASVDPVELRHVQVERPRGRTARRRGPSRAPRAASRWPRPSCPSARAASSGSAGSSRCRRRRARAGRRGRRRRAARGASSAPAGAPRWSAGSVLPSPATPALSAVSEPPISSASRRLMARPRPVPP